MNISSIRLLEKNKNEYKTSCKLGTTCIKSFQEIYNINDSMYPNHEIHDLNYETIEKDEFITFKILSPVSIHESNKLNIAISMIHILKTYPNKLYKTEKIYYAIGKIRFDNKLVEIIFKDIYFKLKRLTEMEYTNPKLISTKKSFCIKENRDEFVKRLKLHNEEKNIKCNKLKLTDLNNDKKYKNSEVQIKTGKSSITEPELIEQSKMKEYLDISTLEEDKSAELIEKSQSSSCK